MNAPTARCARETRRPGRRWMGWLAAGAALVLLPGCATPLSAARANFYGGRLDRAELSLADESKVQPNDRVLFLMERGTVRQAAGLYAESARDYIAAQETLEKMQIYSVSKGAASLVINDNVQPYIGTPYERAMLHSMTAFSHMALGAWDDIGVEARRLLETIGPERRGDFPEDALSRYVAGLAFELEDDPSNAEIQYKQAAALAPPGTAIDAQGRLQSPPSAAGTGNGASGELICFVLAGQGPDGQSLIERGGLPYFSNGYAEIMIGGAYAGRSYPLADVAQLALLTEEKLAAMKAAKTATRIVIKKVAAEAIGNATNNHDLGDLVFFLLLMFEQPDLRRWETLPRSFQVARVPCPLPLESFDVVWKGGTMGAPERMTVTQPIHRRRNLVVSVVRDLPLPPPPAATPAP